GEKPIPIDIRIIAASQEDLRAAVNAKHFRSDLYYRLCVLEIALPPLRDRPADLPLLVEAFLSERDAKSPIVTELRSPAFLARLEAHTWPGNVRELRNHIERCLALTVKHAAELDDFDKSDNDLNQPLRVAREQALRAFESKYLAAM